MLAAMILAATVAVKLINRQKLGGKAFGREKGCFE